VPISVAGLFQSDSHCARRYQLFWRSAASFRACLRSTPKRFLGYEKRARLPVRGTSPERAVSCERCVRHSPSNSSTRAGRSNNRAATRGAHSASIALVAAQKRMSQQKQNKRRPSQSLDEWSVFPSLLDSVYHARKIWVRRLSSPTTNKATENGCPGTRTDLSSTNVGEPICGFTVPVVSISDSQR
jgi:hypothetical protein